MGRKILQCSMGLGYLLLLLCTICGAEETWVVQRLVAMDYPPLAQQARIQGIVTVECRVGTDGAVMECKAVSGHPLLQCAAENNARRWRFRPTVPDAAGESVRLRYEFVLQGDAVPHRPKVEFAFEYPNLIRITSEMPCSDHIPCTEKEWEQFRKDQQRSKRKWTRP